MKKNVKTSSDVSVLDAEHELRALRQKCVILGYLYGELVHRYGRGAEESEYLKVGRDDWQAPMRDVVEALGFDIAMSIKATRDRCKELEAAKLA